MRRRNPAHSNRSTWIGGGVVAVFVLALAALVAAVVLVAQTQGAGPRGISASSLTPQVTLYATAPPPATQAPAVPAATEEAATSTPEPSPTPQVTQYTIVEGDTLWDIAVRFGQSLDARIAVNPNLNPDLVRPGDIVNIPGPNTPIPTRAPVAASSVEAQVSLDGSGLRLRAGPSTNDEVITKLAPGTILDVQGRTSDNQWLRVTTPQGTQGWVMRQFVDVYLDLAQVPAQAGGASSAAAPGADAPAASAAFPQSAPVDDPNFSGVPSRVYQIFAAGQSLGNRANVFSIVGDSNTANTAFLAPFDWGNYNLGSNGYLQGTVDFFRGSFSRNRITARGGFSTDKALDPALAPAGCAGGESSLSCEIRLNRPSVALILLGTGDQHIWQGFEGRYRQIIETLINQGVIPVLMTKGDDLEAIDSNAPYDFINGIIRRLSREYGVPLLDTRQALASLPNRGFEADGFHINRPPDGKPADLYGGYLNYGYNMLNLTTMRALDALRRQVLQR